MSVSTGKKIRKLTDKIVASYHEESSLIRTEAKSQVNNAIVIQILGQLQKLIFVGFFGSKRTRMDTIEYETGALIESLFHDLKVQIAFALAQEKEPDPNPEEAEYKTYLFLEKIPQIRKILATDVEAAYEGDPAAASPEEIILCYPGLYAIMVNRLAHELHLLNIPLIPRLMTEHAHNLTGIDIHPGASIGHHFFIDHGTGIVIGETTEIGNYVKVYQGVTLGALSTRGGQSLRGTKRHPTICDRVTIYSGASILGGETIIGEEITISSNAFITESILKKK